MWCYRYEWCYTNLNVIGMITNDAYMIWNQLRSQSWMICEPLFECKNQVNALINVLKLSNFFPTLMLY